MSSLARSRDPEHAVRLSELTTLRLGGPARRLLRISDADQLPDALGDGPTLVIGGGSNLVIADRGIDATVVKIEIPGIRVRGDEVTIGAGMDWEQAVAELVDAGFCGLAPLSGIPGSSGATPVQNVGAYGTELGDLLTAVTLYDRQSGTCSSVPAAKLDLGYRSSSLRGNDRYVVVDLTMRLSRTPQPVRYRELAGELGVQVGDLAPEREVRRAVLSLRRRKGMVLDPDDPDTRSAGSFFTNPMLTPAELAVTDQAIRRQLGEVAYPQYPADGGRTKLSAAWLIERAGIGKGHPGPGGRVAVSSKHTLALTNIGGTTADLLQLAREIRDLVLQVFAVRLVVEPLIIGTSLDG